MMIVKKPIFMFILGIIIAGSIGVIATSLSANNISYGNGTVKDALDELYTGRDNLEIISPKLTANGDYFSKSVGLYTGSNPYYYSFDRNFNTSTILVANGYMVFEFNESTNIHCITFLSSSNNISVSIQGSTDNNEYSTLASFNTVPGVNKIIFTSDSYKYIKFKNEDQSNQLYINEVQMY